ncbi:protein Aster-C [Lates japonicus]|uniref:Protein Aster-C n=1 Tax=Lates japonicus TaxID=270547 RepID=A0AAD3RP71_LATJO|nr:protein Aster-C [Lates japonicus]
MKGEVSLEPLTSYVKTNERHQRGDNSLKGAEKLGPLCASAVEQMDQVSNRSGVGSDDITDETTSLVDVRWSSDEEVTTVSPPAGHPPPGTPSLSENWLLFLQQCARGTKICPNAQKYLTLRLRRYRNCLRRLRQTKEFSELPPDCEGPGGDETREVMTLLRLPVVEHAFRGFTPQGKTCLLSAHRAQPTRMTLATLAPAGAQFCPLLDRLRQNGFQTPRFLTSTPMNA